MKLPFPNHSLLEPSVEVLLPAVREEKFSLNKVVTPPPAGLMVIDRAAVPVPAELVAEIVTLLDPAVVGVPEIAPVVAFTANPFGKPVAA